MKSTPSKSRKRFVPILIGFIFALILVASGSAWLLLGNDIEPNSSNTHLVLNEVESPVATVNGVAIMPTIVDREVRVSRFNIVAPLLRA